MQGWEQSCLNACMLYNREFERLVRGEEAVVDGEEEEDEHDARSAGTIPAEEEEEDEEVDDHAGASSDV